MKKWGLRWSTTFSIAIMLVFVLVLSALPEPQQPDLQELQRAINRGSYNLGSGSTIAVEIPMVSSDGVAGYR